MANKKNLEESKLNNLDFLNLDTKEKCYLLGLLMADGYITKNSLWMYLVEDDLINLQPLLNKVLPFNYYRRELKNRKPQMCLNIHSRHLIKSLNTDFQFNDKSNVFYDININKKYLKYYLRGYFDGDGCFFIKSYFDKRRNKNYINSSFNVSSTHNFDWSNLESILKEYNIEYRIVRYNYPEKNSKFSRIVITKKSEMLKLINFLYEDKYDNIGLLRKYNKAKEIKNFINEKVKSTLA